MFRSFLAAFCAAALAASAGAQSLMVIESTNKRVLLLDEFDGSVVNANFIDLSIPGVEANTPIQAQVVNGEIWITDQLKNSVFRFSMDGTTHLGTTFGGLSNIRGFEVANGQVYVSNAGTANGAPGESLVLLDLAGNVTGSFPVTDPFDVLDYNGQLLIANISANHIDIHDYAGNFVGKFNDGAITFPEQLSHGFGGNVLAAGFSSPSGIYEYDSNGVQLNYYNTGSIGGHTGLRGVWQLGNGDILYTNGSGFHILDTVNLTVSTVVGGVSGRFVGLLPPSEPGFGYCFGDGSGTACPCANMGGPGQGCANGTGQGGVLAASGSASVSSNDLVLGASNAVAGVSGLFFQGDDVVNMGLGATFGDGLRCAATNVVRLQQVTTSGTGTAQSSVSIAGVGGVAPGQTKRYQFWYRDPATSPCGPNPSFNLTGAYEIAWTP